jgi:hypothetical protein
MSIPMKLIVTALHVRPKLFKSAATIAAEVDRNQGRADAPIPAKLARCPRTRLP